MDYGWYWQLGLMFCEHSDGLGCETWLSWQSRHFSQQKKMGLAWKFISTIARQFTVELWQFGNVLLGNYAWINQNKVCFELKLAGFWLNYFGPENWLSEPWLWLNYLAACPRQWFQQVREIFLVVIVLKNYFIILFSHHAPPWKCRNDSCRFWVVDHSV